MSDEELKQYFRVGCPLNFAGVQISVISAQPERQIFSGQPTKAHWKKLAMNKTALFEHLRS